MINVKPDGWVMTEWLRGNGASSRYLTLPYTARPTRRECIKDYNEDQIANGGTIYAKLREAGWSQVIRYYIETDQ